MEYIKIKEEMKPNDIQIDGIDKVILHELIKDGRVPVLDIARKVGISGAAIHQRIKKMERSGLLEGTQARINPKTLGYNTIAFIGVFFDHAARYNEATIELKKIPQVIECHYTTGTYSLLLKVMSIDNEHLMTILNGTIQNIKGIARTETFISLKNPISRQLTILHPV